MSWFYVEPKCLSYVWGHDYIGLSIAGGDMDLRVEGGWVRALLLLFLPRKCLGFSVGPLSVLVSVWGQLLDP